MISSDKLNLKITNMKETLLNQIDKLNEYLHLESDINKKDFKYIDTMLQSMRNEAINYTRCSLQLKDKKAPTFEHWLICNFEETKTGKYIDFNNGETYRDKQVLKLKYDKIFKPTL